MSERQIFPVEEPRREPTWEDVKEQFARAGRQIAEAFNPRPTQEDYALAPDGIKCSYCGFKIIDVPLDRLVFLDEGTPNEAVYHDNCWAAANRVEEEEPVEINDAMNSAPYDGHNWFRLTKEEEEDYGLVPRPEPDEN